jgi:hypothetical protein
MSTRQKKSIHARKYVVTCAYLRSISRECLEHAEESPDGRSLYLSASMVFSAFTVEAFLNHVGLERVPSWDLVERKLSPLEKMELLSRLAGITVESGKRPFQTLSKMFKFRDSLAHGKTEVVVQQSIQSLKPGQKPDLPKTEWEKEISLPTAKRYFDDATAIVRLFTDKLGLEPAILASHGSWEYTAATLDRI